MQHSNGVPLTFSQKVRLLVECLPLPFFILGLVFVVTVLDDITGVPPSRLLILFLVAVIVIVGWAAVNRMRDFVSGVAVVQEDILHQAWRSRTSRTNPFRGRFKQLGSMRLSAQAWGQTQNGARYRVYYSPASKVVWSLEKLE